MLVVSSAKLTETMSKYNSKLTVRCELTTNHLNSTACTTSPPKIIRSALKHSDAQSETRLPSWQRNTPYSPRNDMEKKLCTIENPNKANEKQMRVPGARVKLNKLASIRAGVLVPVRAPCAKPIITATSVKNMGSAMAGTRNWAIFDD